jgi:hypothetical protein
MAVSVDPNPNGPIPFTIMLTANRTSGSPRLPISRSVRWLFGAGFALAFVPLVACSSTPQDGESLGVTSSDVTVSGLFSTGVDSTGAPLAVGAIDPHYVLTSTDAMRPGPNAPVLTPNPAWAPNTAGSRWIGAAADGQGANLAYTYTVTFTLAGVNPATAVLTGTWACDDSCALELNGTQVASRAAPAYGSTAPFTVPAGTLAFLPGTNTLAFVVTNSGGGPTGLQVVSLSIAASCTTDAVCAANQFCNTATGVCAAKLANKTPIPTIANHTPVLNGTCSAAVGTAVCASAVCGSNNECGLADGQGPCVAAVTGSVVCQSGACSTDLLCEPAGGCNVDADCTAAQFCNTQTNLCAAKLANKTAIPTIANHTPVLNGTCSAAVGTAVCVSAVCGSNNECGLANGDGPCVAAVTGSLVCQSGSCSTNLKCEPAGGCNVDADCTAAQFCNTQTNVCAAKLASGTPIPTIANHTPVLNGTCSATVGTSVCAAAVCDTNNECGLAVNDGPCVAAVSGSVVCQSGACSTNLKCEPAGGCNVDADCTGANAGKWCNETTHACTAKLANGSPIPTDGPHTNPTLTGTCNAAVGTLVCASGVCDTVDNKCGIADGDPGCTLATAAECRSGDCSLTGNCLPSGSCNVDADCASGHWCDESTHACMAQLPDLSPIPTDAPHTNPTLNGACSVAAATLVCQSGLCNSTSNTCVQCTSANTAACTGLTPVCGPAGACIAVVDAGVDAGGGLDAGLDAGADSGTRADGGADASADSGADGGANKDAGGAGDSGALADAEPDSSSGDDASLGDDASEGPDATTGGGPDGSQGTQNGAGVSGELEGGGLSCSVSWSRSPESSGGPLLMLAIALGAAFGRGRRNR